MLVATILFAVTFPSSTADPLFAQRVLTCADWVQEANKCIAMGQEKAIANLIERSEVPEEKGSRIGPNHRATLLARLLFTSNGKQPLRGPSLGAFMLPYRSMPLADWPTYPFVEQDGVVFLLSDAVGVGGGFGEKCKAYIDYCLKNGKFRTTPYKVPTEKEALDAMRSLYATPRWKNIQWSFESPNQSYRCSPVIVTDFLQRQAQL